MADARQFRIELERFLEEAKKRGGQLVREVTLRAFAGVVLKSPVGNNSRWKVNQNRKGKPLLPKGYVGGHFRKNWRLDVGTKPIGVVAGVDPSGNEAQSAALQLLAARQAQVDRFEPVWIVNNLPYAEPLENGWSRQAPLGMVAQTVAEISSRFGGVQ